MNDWAKKIASGDPRALARAATAIENHEPGAQELLAELRSGGSHPLVLGVTGPPGAGKSTLVDRLAGAFRKQGKTVAISPATQSTPSPVGRYSATAIAFRPIQPTPGVSFPPMPPPASLAARADPPAGLC